MTTLRRAAATAVALAALTLTSCASGDKTATPTATPTSTTADAVAETFPDEGVSTTSPPESVTGKVGETVTLTSVDTGEEVAQIKVDRIKTSSGDEYNRPERGLFLGVLVKTKALADDQSSLWGDIYVTMRGHHYDGDAYADGFTPSLDYVDLNKGETAEGWLVFDVPARHGQVVLAQSDGGGKIATWSF
jgi:hypothetical protein